METYRRVQSSVSFQYDLSPLSSNRNREPQANYNDTVYLVSGSQGNTVWSHAPTNTIVYSRRVNLSNSANPNLRRNVSVPIINNAGNVNVRRSDTNTSTDTISANRYLIPNRQLSVPTISNINMTTRHSELLRIHQEIARYHNALQSRLRNSQNSQSSPRFIYQPTVTNSPDLSQFNPSRIASTSTFVNTSSNTNTPRNGFPLTVVNNYTGGHGRNISIGTRNFSMNNSRRDSINSNQMVSLPTQSINLVEPIEIRLPPQIIESFPINHFEGNASDLDENLRTCSVCLEEYQGGEEIRRLPCTHFYHKNCIDTWLRKSTRCPICKFDYIVMVQI